VVRQGLAGIGIGLARRTAAGHGIARGDIDAPELAEGAQHIVAPFVGHVLVADPAHAGGFEAFRVGGPGVAGIHAAGHAVDGVPLVGDEGRAGRDGAVGAGKEEGAVRIGSRVHRAVVGIAQREGIRQGEVEGDLALLEVAHRDRVLVARPLVHAAVVPGLLAVVPVVRRAVRALGVAHAAVQVEGHDHVAVRQALLPHLAPVRQGDREAVAEAAHAGQGAEIMVEGAVFLHQDHHVLDVLDGAGLVVGGDSQCALDGRREGCVGGCRDTRAGAVADETAS
jgi:hypothetical protein